MDEPGHYLKRMREVAPLIHNITNYVAMNIMANVLLAAGASPAMVHARAEVAEFAGLAQALTVNIGTPDPDWAEAMVEAAQVMQARGCPWVFDPVGVGATRFRKDVSARLLELRPSVIRGNASEILALAGLGGRGRGADAADDVQGAEEAARALARRCGGIVGVSGAVDFVTDGERACRIANGDALMPRITALGCSLNGVIAAFCVDQPPFEATTAAFAYYGLAGEIAARRSDGPGGFQPAFLDALYALTPDKLTAGARITPA